MMAAIPKLTMQDEAILASVAAAQTGRYLGGESDNSRTLHPTRSQGENKRPRHGCNTKEHSLWAMKYLGRNLIGLDWTHDL